MEYKLLSLTTISFSLKNKLNPKKEYNLMPAFGKNVVNIAKDVYELHLFFSLHDRDEDVTPYDIDLEIKGVFEFRDGSEEDIDYFMDNNAVAITFPYLRSVLSTSMASMMLSPIMLPIVDAKEIFRKENIK